MQIDVTDITTAMRSTLENYIGEITDSVSFSAGRPLSRAECHRVYQQVSTGVIRLAEEMEDAVRREREEKAEQEAAFRQEAERIRCAPEYQHLSQEPNGAVQVAGNLRRELKRVFPGVAFSVRKRSGNYVAVRWTDGPTEEQVSTVTGKYKDGHYDGMQDLHVYCVSPFNTVFGGVSYLFTERSHSDDMKLRAIAVFKEKYGHAVKDKDISLARFKNGELWRVGNEYFHHGHGVQYEINKILSGMAG